MITLKKSFELQNYMSQLLNSALSILSRDDFITTTKQNHLRNKAYSEAENEEVVVKRLIELPFSVNELVDFVDLLVGEIEKLTIAINDGKHYLGDHFDAMIAINGKKRNILRRYEVMASMKPSESIVKGTAEKFNEAGEQVPYRYDIEQVTTIDFDRNEIKKKVSRLRKEIEKTSDDIDAFQLRNIVDYEPIFEIGESLEDAIENRLEK